MSWAIFWLFVGIPAIITLVLGLIGLGICVIIDQHSRKDKS